MDGQLALLILVLVDVTRPGFALVQCNEGAGWSGSIIRLPDPHKVSLPFIVETSTGEVIGRARSYKEAAIRLAGFHGIAKPYVTVEIEREHRPTL